MGVRQGIRKNNIIHFIAGTASFLAGFSGTLLLIRAVYIYFIISMRI